MLDEMPKIWVGDSHFEMWVSWMVMLSIAHRFFAACCLRESGGVNGQAAAHLFGLLVS